MTFQPPGGYHRPKPRLSPTEQKLLEMQPERIHASRIVQWKDQWFIAIANLRLYEDYYDATVGDIIIVQGSSGIPLFFELAARVEEKGPNDEPAFMLIRIIPEEAFDALPTLDVNPEDAVRLDAPEETDGSG